jgi:single-strand DNA-binding protein
MSDTITLTGIVATTPRHLVTSSGLAITSFRLASGQRRFDRAKNEWVDASTNWYTVSAFRHLAHNVVRSVRKGEHVLVAGRLRIRDWENADRAGTAVEVEADCIGHDLSWCTTTFVRSMPASVATQQPAEPEDTGRATSPGAGELERPEAIGDGFLPTETVALAAVDS